MVVENNKFKVPKSYCALCCSSFDLTQSYWLFLCFENVPYVVSYQITSYISGLWYTHTLKGHFYQVLNVLSWTMIKVSHGGQTAVKVDTLTPQTVVIASKANTFWDRTGKLFTAAACSKIADSIHLFKFSRPPPTSAIRNCGSRHFRAARLFCKMWVFDYQICRCLKKTF